MPPLRRSERRVFQAWIRRALAGYWTHAGYLNWDSGLGFARWHQSKKLGLAQQALIGIATADELQPSPEWRRWAKWMLDAGLTWYDRLTEREGLPKGLLFGVSVIPQAEGTGHLAAARIEANAARAVAAGLGRMPARRPPSLYAYDPDIGRLAVTTPAYNTAIVADNRGAFPYGGVELARLYDGEQNVAANIGGRAPAAFGLTVARPGGGTLLATQDGRRNAALRLARAPSGVSVARARARAYAGPFSLLEAVGTTRRGHMLASTRYRFRPASIEGRWTLRRDTRDPVDVQVTFPSWGREAQVVATARDGRSMRVGSEAIPLSDIASLHVVGERGGYRVEPVERPVGAAVRLLPTAPQSSAPKAGPSLAIEVGQTTEERLGIAVRLVVDRP